MKSKKSINKKLIVFATLAEAMSTMRLLHATPVDPKQKTYHFAQGMIVISGVGNIAAAHVVGRYAHDFEQIWNFGFAGMLNSSLPLNSTYRISEVSKNLSWPTTIDSHSQKFAESHHPKMQIACEGIRLISSDYPIHDIHIKNELSVSADCVDMEGYGIAYAAQQAQKPCFLYKIISDFSEKGGQHIIARNIEMLSEKLAEVVMGVCDSLRK